MATTKKEKLMILEVASSLFFIINGIWQPGFLYKIVLIVIVFYDFVSEAIHKFQISAWTVEGNCDFSITYFKYTTIFCCFKNYQFSLVYYFLLWYLWMCHLCFFSKFKIQAHYGMQLDKTAWPKKGRQAFLPHNVWGTIFSFDSSLLPTSYFHCKSGQHRIFQRLYSIVCWFVWD